MFVLFVKRNLYRYSPHSNNGITTSAILFHSEDFLLHTVSLHISEVKMALVQFYQYKMALIQFYQYKIALIQFSQYKMALIQFCQYKMALFECYQYIKQACTCSLINFQFQNKQIKWLC
jgi:hypothetical protein